MLGIKAVDKVVGVAFGGTGFALGDYGIFEGHGGFSLWLGIDGGERRSKVEG